MNIPQNLIAPALGTTGQKLHNYLPKLLYDNALISDADTEIYLLNSIQYQCSLGFEPKECRNIVFDALWAQEFIRNSLVKRINSINPQTIIVATTASFKKKHSTLLKVSLIILMYG